MSRFWLRFGDREVALPDGEVLVGRGQECHVRLMSAAVSRRHLRLLSVAEMVMAYDLDSRNGTWVNGTRLQEPLALGDGDMVQVGTQTFEIREAEYAKVWEEEPDTAEMDLEPIRPKIEGRPRGHRSTIELDQASLERARLASASDPDDDDLAVGRQVCAVCGATFEIGQPVCPICLSEPYSAPTYRTCPGCKSLVSDSDALCPKCGYVQPASSLEADSERRREPRHPIASRGLYVSSSLTFEAEVINISRGGLFIVAELLDPVGTSADIVLVTGDRGRARFSGEVAHVIDEASPEDDVKPGMGVRFIDIAPSAQKWLDNFLADKGL